MDHAILNTILITMITGLILALSAITWFAIQRWVMHVDSLSQSIDSLKEVIFGFRDEYITKAEHAISMKEVHSAIGGRRQSDSCPEEKCPLGAGKREHYNG